MSVNRTWSALLEELVEIQRGGSGVGFLGARGWCGRLLCFLHRIFKRSAGVGPGGHMGGKTENIMRLMSDGGIKNICNPFLCCHGVIFTSA